MGLRPRFASSLWRGWATASRVPFSGAGPSLRVRLVVGVISPRPPPPFVEVVSPVLRFALHRECLQAAFVRSGTLCPLLPCKGRRRNPPPPEAGGPLHGTGAASVRPSPPGPLQSATVALSLSFVPLPSPGPHCGRSAVASRTFCRGLGGTYSRAPGALVGTRPSRPLHPSR